MLLSLQGSMAVGKTTAMHYLEKEAPYLHLSYEENRAVVEEIKGRQLNKNAFEDYVEIQRLWIQHEIKRWEMCQHFPCTVMDFGPEEIEFHTLMYPRIVGKDWDVETALHEELQALRQCQVYRILWLEASDETLQRHKENDPTRSRNSFDGYIRDFLPLKREFLFAKGNMDILQVDDLTKEEVGQSVREWCRRQIKSGRCND